MQHQYKTLNLGKYEQCTAEYEPPASATLHHPASLAAARVACEGGESSSDVHTVSCGLMADHLSTKHDSLLGFVTLQKCLKKIEKIMKCLQSL